MWIQDGPMMFTDPSFVFDPSWDIVGGDLDGDGLEDAVVQGYATNVLFAGLGNAMTLYHAIEGSFRRAAIGNFDGAGLPEVITTEPVNQGTIVTTWVSPVIEAAGWYSTWWPFRVDVTRTADVNVDGYMDIVGGTSTMTIAYGGPEADGIACVSNVETPLSPYVFAVGDMSGDGRPDIALSDGVSLYVMLRTD